MMIIPVLIIFIFGLVIGSFLNVVILRTLREESPIEGRSRCDSCRAQIAWYDNIPLLSYLILRGKCRMCRAAIPPLHPIVEGTTGILFVWWYMWGFLFFQLTQQPFVVIQPLFWLTVAVLLVIIFFSDLTAFIIPDFAVGSLFAIALMYRIALVVFGIMQPTDFLMTMLAMIGNAGFFLLLFILTRGKGMGFGDVKYALVMALLLGWPGILVGVFLSFVLGSVIGMLLLATGRRQLKQPIPFGPFLIAGTVIALLVGEQLLQWYIAMI